MCGSDTDSQACIRQLEVGGQTESDVGKAWIALDDMEINGFRRRTLFENCLCSWRLQDRESWGASFHYACFVPRDLFDGAAQHPHMIDAQTCDSCDGG